MYLFLGLPVLPQQGQRWEKALRAQAATSNVLVALGGMEERGSIQKEELGYILQKLLTIVSSEVYCRQMWNYRARGKYLQMGFINK